MEARQRRLIRLQRVASIVADSGCDAGGKHRGLLSLFLSGFSQAGREVIAERETCRYAHVEAGVTKRPQVMVSLRHAALNIRRRRWTVRNEGGERTVTRNDARRRLHDSRESVALIRYLGVQLWQALVLRVREVNGRLPILIVRQPDLGTIPQRVGDDLVESWLRR